MAAAYVSETKGNFFVGQVAASQTDYAFTIPAKTSHIQLIASGGAVTIKLTAGAAGLTTIPSGQSLPISTDSFGLERLSGAVLYITTPGGTTCDIFAVLGNPE